jgi:tripartite-type tricarboxylate transporter receptor subunit TctC
MRTTKRRLLGAFTLAVACMTTQSAFAQGYPAKPVRFIVAFAPGGPADIIGRLIGQRLGDTWGQPVIVENRPGAGGNVASSIVAKAPADGYTVLVNTSALAVNVSLMKDTAGYVAE